MKRSLIVVAGTAAGVTAVVSYHAAATGSTSNLARSGGAVSASTGSPSTRTSSTARRGRLRTRSAVGRPVSYPYGRLQVEVTERAGKITHVSLVTLRVPDAHSQSVDAQALPQLEREVVADQSAHVDGISGASYTVAAYEQSVQSALDRL